ncbi:MAG: alpha/beta hydrolase, partial [Pseudomonadota bacterium]|nr:alpha/beta hydrolase [Pseudomonadota bacterium]
MWLQLCRIVLVAAFGLAAPARAQVASDGVRKLADIAYGAAPRQVLDVYLPPPGRALKGGAPILLMVHGGAWMFGDKSNPGVVVAKVAHWCESGWIFVSVNNRLHPEAAPLEQAADVARALAFVQQRAAAWGGDPGRIVLMGHSAGAHLVALLDASPSLATAAGAGRWSASVVLDSAATDLEALMMRRHARFYDSVFGSEPQLWQRASPLAQLSAAAPPLLLVCS